MNIEIQKAHELAAEAHEEAAKASAESRKYTDEQRMTDTRAIQVQFAELRANQNAQEATARVVELTRTAPQTVDLNAGMLAQMAEEAPETSDRHPDEAERTSKAAAQGHRLAAQFYAAEATDHAPIMSGFPKLTDLSHKLFMAYAEDAGNWSGTPLVGGNVGFSKADQGNLTDLKKVGLLTTREETDVVNFKKQTLSWVFFTDLGKAYAKANGCDLDWIE